MSPKSISIYLGLAALLFGASYFLAKRKNINNEMKKTAEEAESPSFKAFHDIIQEIEN